MQESNKSTWIIIGSIIGVIVLLFVARSYIKHAPQAAENISKKTNRELALSCTTDMATKFHIHPFLGIAINGQKQEIPANTGIEKDGCMHPIHTHDATGKLHVESPEARDFTLSDWFAVWGKTFNAAQILDAKVDATHIIRETVNGKEVRDYENTVLRDGDQIVILYEERK